MIQIQRRDNKEKGVLFPVFSLPSRYGIGCFSREAREFIDWLAETGHVYWQILPLNPTGCADSPYQPLSSFAGSAYFIDPVRLEEQGLVSHEELDTFDFGDDPMHADYSLLADSRRAMLRLAFSRFLDRCAADDSLQEDFSGFLRENAFWLDDYALFMSLREEFGREESWDSWPDPLRVREEQAMGQAREEHAEDISFFQWTQYEFYRQWGALRRYAGEKGVKIIGDMPVYVSYDSADCWASPDQFQLDEDLQPKRIAGVPPDDFSEEGQLWGNPLYDWEKMKEEGYRWWLSRIRQCFLLYDVLRLDHFRGYEAYYSTEADAENAMNGRWTPGPGMELFRRLRQAMEEAAGTLKEEDPGENSMKEVFRGRFIAEDLGFLTDDVHELLEATGIPGTKVLQFAFDGDPENMYLTENYRENCAAYTGTHDNDTTAGWFRSLSGDARAGILQYLGVDAVRAWKLVLENDAYEKSRAKEGTGMQEADGILRDGPGSGERAEGAPEDPAYRAAELMVKKVLDSCADIAIIPLQDYLLLGSEARINVPGTIGRNWCWRLTPDQFIKMRRRWGS